MLITHEELFESALNSPYPNQQLWELCAHLLDAGTTHENLYEELSDYMLKLRSQGREEDEDRIADATDYLVGWCGPHRSLVSRGR